MPSRETTVASIASGKTTFDEEPGAATAALHRDIEAQNAITPSPINLSIVPQWFRTALDTASRYSASAGHAVAELFGEAGEAGDISEHYCQRLLVPARASLDALGDQGADELGRHVLLERRQPSAHLQEDAREVVEFAQRRGDSADAIEPEVFNVFELAGNAQQRRSHEAIRRQDCDRRDDHRQPSQRDQQHHRAALDRGKEVAGRDHRRHHPVAEIQRREGHEVVLAVSRAGYLQLARLPQIGEAQAAVLEQCVYRSEHRFVPGARVEFGHFALSLPLQRRRSRRRNHLVVPVKKATVPVFPTCRPARN